MADQATFFCEFGGGAIIGELILFGRLIAPHFGHIVRRH